MRRFAGGPRALPVALALAALGCGAAERARPLVNTLAQASVPVTLGPYVAIGEGACAAATHRAAGRLVGERSYGEWGTLVGEGRSDEAGTRSPPAGGAARAVRDVTIEVDTRFDPETTQRPSTFTAGVRLEGEVVDVGTDRAELPCPSPQGDPGAAR